jgi:hypothetical protein
MRHPGLEQAAVLRDGADVLDAQRRARREPEEIPAPDPRVLLLLDDGLDDLGALYRSARVVRGVLGDRAGRGEFGEGPIADDLAAMGEQPADRDSVRVREIQERPRVWE